MLRETLLLNCKLTAVWAEMSMAEIASLCATVTDFENGALCVTGTHQVRFPLRQTCVQAGCKQQLIGTVNSNNDLPQQASTESVSSLIRLKDVLISPLSNSTDARASSIFFVVFTFFFFLVLSLSPNFLFHSSFGLNLKHLPVELLPLSTKACV